MRQLPEFWQLAAQGARAAPPGAGRGASSPVWPARALISFHVAPVTVRCVPPSPTVLRLFITDECQVLSNAFSAPVDPIMRLSAFAVLDLQILKQPCLPGVNPT